MRDSTGKGPRRHRYERLNTLLARRLCNLLDQNEPRIRRMCERLCAAGIVHADKIALLNYRQEMSECPNAGRLRCTLEQAVEFVVEAPLRKLLDAMIGALFGALAIALAVMWIMDAPRAAAAAATATAIAVMTIGVGAVFQHWVVIALLNAAGAAQLLLTILLATSPSRPLLGAVSTAALAAIYFAVANVTITTDAILLVHADTALLARQMRAAARKHASDLAAYGALVYMLAQYLAGSSSILCSVCAVIVASIFRATITQFIESIESKD